MDGARRVSYGGPWMIGGAEQKKKELRDYFHKKLEELSRERPWVCRSLGERLQVYSTAEVVAGEPALTVWDVVYQKIRERVAQREAQGETMSEEQFIDLLFARSTSVEELNAEVFFRRLHTG